MNSFSMRRTSAVFILKGLWPKAQGCEERATLGTNRKCSQALKGLSPGVRERRDATLSGLTVSWLFTQGSSFLATLGFKPESLQDSNPLRFAGAVQRT